MILKSGDMIEVLQQDASGWWKGRIPLVMTSSVNSLPTNANPSYRVGVFPYNFVEVET